MPDSGRRLYPFWARALSSLHRLQAEEPGGNIYGIYGIIFDVDHGEIAVSTWQWLIISRFNAGSPASPQPANPTIKAGGRCQIPR